MSAILATLPLQGPPWPTLDPFLFCVHHKDDYPAGDADFRPRASLAGRNIGSDFSGREGWSMYHGEVVPGFPRHPHRGFETVTLARRGFIDHSDSMGATARFGDGDVQWMTAGRGVVHSEMFPLVQQDRGNPTELFQIWMNLPAHDKMVEPHFRMLWSETIPRRTLRDAAGRGIEVVVVAGALGDARAPAPPPKSWAARDENHVAIWTIRMEPGAVWALPPAAAGAQRVLYAFDGGPLAVEGTALAGPSAVQVRAEAAPRLENRGAVTAELLLLQGRPIGEPVARHGPFVMNTRVEIEQAYADYRSTGFGGWPWRRDDPVHPRAEGRFALHAGGRVDRPA
jgi:redox-sensitive bicupin YhaK (pirin superfamily)